MKTWSMLSLSAIFFMIVIPFLNAADLPTKADRPVVKVGDTWTYIKTVGSNTRTSTHKVVELLSGGGFQVEVSSSNGNWTEKYDLNGNIVEDGGAIFSPSREVFRFPLETGKVYSGAEFVKASKKDPSKKITMKAEVKAITLEKVVVKAGTFNALKVEVEIPYEGRGRTGKSVASRVAETFWYAPEVGRWVKRQYNDVGNPGLEIWEMENFKRGS